MWLAFSCQAHCSVHAIWQVVDNAGLAFALVCLVYFCGPWSVAWIRYWSSVASRFCNSPQVVCICACVWICVIQSSLNMRCNLSCCRHAAQRLAPMEQSLLVGTFLFCSLLFFLIDGDMYYTCRFYHAPIQNFWAVILGIVVFQLPLSWWLIRGKSGQLASLWSSAPREAGIEMHWQPYASLFDFVLLLSLSMVSCRLHGTPGTVVGSMLCTFLW